jgi:O-antigen/teichoic acid export membrane protein
MACAITIYTNLDIVMLGFMKTNVDVGYYSVAVKIKNVLIGLITSLGAVLLPRSSYYIKHKLFDEFKKVSTKAMSFILTFTADDGTVVNQEIKVKSF